MRLSLIAALAALILLPGCQTALRPMKIIAHRGASADAPENTLSAMRLAWEQNADAIELDLWLSKDGKLVVFHDATTKRFEPTARNVPDLTWAEMRQLDVGAWKGPQYAGEKIPTLESILATIPKGRRAVLEIKCGPEILTELERVIRNSGREDKELVIISFNLETLKQSKPRFPQIEHYLLHGYKKDPQTGTFPELGPLIRQCRENNFDGLNLHYDWPITAEFVHEVKAAGLKLFVWTVDDAAIAKKALEAGADGITTNRPQWLREQLDLPR